MKRRFNGFILLCVSLLVSSTTLIAQTNTEQKTEIVNGKTYIIHQVKAKETYYALSRTYSIPVNDIMAANNKKNLRVGDIVRIPSTVTEERQSLTSTPSSPSTSVSPEDILTDYKVGSKETLYAIAKRFQTNVEDIKRLNNLKSDNLKEGQILRIPDGNLPPEPVAAIEPAAPVEKIDDVPVRNIQAGRYGVRETSEKGIAVWMENLETKNNSNLALHKTAPVGTILKITNPISNSVTYAKVVGKFAENTETQDAIVVVSKSAAAYIGAVDKRFRIEITYGIPTE
ncbi:MULTISPECIES: LysM peptidoglycan-binding domain-containing protein [Sphingobacterium]|uniref:LysM peptidoglycan-binding domain-containing protein n=1 Tax=Sphingobacterium populi TaxID=1812824 RepID=A0ABW5U9S1_9SPHI|nr:LysM peptidoglycan-binding domain-containing protein [Sphingobacterium sp. CFCC 11742]